MGQLTEAEASNGIFYFKEKTRLVMVQIEDNLKLKHQEFFFKDEKKVSKDTFSWIKIKDRHIVIGVGKQKG